MGLLVKVDVNSRYCWYAGLIEQKHARTHARQGPVMCGKVALKGLRHYSFSDSDLLCSKSLKLQGLMVSP